jgi:transposase InsO family protein
MPKPYNTPSNPGEKVQIDVKYVPKECCVGKAGKLYQYTAIDECTRLRFRVIYDEHSSYNAARFLDAAVKFYPFRIQCAQTDNGTEFTNALVGSDKPSAFESCRLKHGIAHKRIRVATPRRNG